MMRSVGTRSRAWEAWSEDLRVAGQIANGKVPVEFGLSAWRSKARPSSIESARRQFIFAPTQEVSEFVQIGQPDFLPENIDFRLGEIPQTLDVQEDLRWRRIILRQFSPVRIAGEQPEDVGLEALGEHVLAGHALVVNRD